MSTRRERMKRRAEKRTEWAESANRKSAAGFDRASKIANSIPLGQPILVGHHSERHARRDQERIENGMRKGCEMAQKAADHLSKAGNIEDTLDRTIFNDDPDAIERLEQRIETLSRKREQMKKANSWWRKHKTMEGFDGLTAEKAAPLDEKIRASYSWEQRPYPAYTLTNLGARIRTDQQRIEAVKVRQARIEKADVTGGTLIEELPQGYTRVTFRDYPGREIIQTLKAAGFHWSDPSWVGRTESMPEMIRRSS